MKIAIIGGSIAGCAVALLLKDQFDITVFERSKDLKSRGAGLTISKELLQTLISKDLIDKETTGDSFSTRSFYCQLPSKPDYGHCLWHQNISIVSLHWDTLFLNLRKRIPDKLYKNECRIIDVQLKDGEPGQIILESGETQEFDLIIFADGAQSMGRKLISENSQLTYSGYVAWRGTLDFDLIKDKSPFINNISYYCFNNGHLLAYPVEHDGIKKLNWVFYEKLPIEHLDTLGQTTQINFSETAMTHLHQLANSKLPKAIAQIILNTKSPFMQKVVDVAVERLVTKGALLLGDASVVLRPHVGSGASLAIQDALNLRELLNIYNDISQALTQWEKCTLSNRLSTYELSKRMADALVLHPILWQGMNESKMDTW
ncbi:FAD-dependent monooxygenase [uncultured Legionella sp.]|uniref:FAD binding domain-containing protein n=1 Tax=uncultured Legionella sp. TaxID=210934 RepID=UPI0026108D57|nr:FAD-dependent monooxygenase [uncultured Legionella sp.]